MIERYQTEKIKNIFSEENKLATWIKIEIIWLKHYLIFFNQEDSLLIKRLYNFLDELNLTEFKVPYKRPPHFDGSVDTEYLTATNHVKKNYWVQMQLQMEVLDVNENDYLDLKVVEPAEIFHLRDRPGRFSGYSFINPDDPKTYIYSFDLPQMDVERYENERPTGFSYWSVEYYHLVTIHRDKDWFAGYLPLLKKLWDDVLVERNFDL